MATFEDEFRRVEPILNRWISFIMLGKKIEVKGEDSFVQEGSSIIIGNHCGAAKDVATILRIVPRHIYFTANKQIFTREDFDRLIAKHLMRHLKEFGPVVNMMARPLKSLFIRFISSNIARVGTIPVDMQSSKREAMKMCQTYLEKGRAIIALQGRGRVHPRAAHPYVSPFRRGVSILAYNLYDSQGISVPVTPLAMFGTQLPWLIPGKIHVNVGEPMYIRDYLKSNFEDSIENFKNALEARVKTLFLELIRA
jgi:1-acyl-sn-glycerol-3-phosphate acyltransferase